MQVSMEFKGRKDECPGSNRESKFTLSPAFLFSYFNFNESDDIHPHWERPYAFLSLPVQISISSRNTLTDTSKKRVLPAI